MAGAFFCCDDHHDLGTRGFLLRRPSGSQSTFLTVMPRKFVSHLKQIEGRGGRLAVLDPRRQATVEAGAGEPALECIQVHGQGGGMPSNGHR